MEYRIQKLPEGGYVVLDAYSPSGKFSGPLYASFMVDDALAFVRKKLKEGDPETAMEHQARMMANSFKPGDIIPVDSDMRPTGKAWGEL